MNKYDLLPNISEFLDPHFLLPILQWLIKQNVYDPKSIKKASLEITKNTLMHEYSLNLYKDIHDTKDSPKGLQDKCKEIHETLKNITRKSINICNTLKSTPKLFETISIEILYKYSQFRYECGQYDEISIEMLKFYGSLTDSKNILKQKWAILANKILLAQWDHKNKEILWEGALKSFYDIFHYIDTSSVSNELNILTSRIYLLHWSLFILFNLKGGHNMLIECFTKERWIESITLTSRHLLRYLAFSLILQFEESNILNQYHEFIFSDNKNNNDPIVSTFINIEIDYNFDGIIENLNLCKEIIRKDFFICNYEEIFMKGVKKLIFRNYCKIFSFIKMEFIVNLIDYKNEDNDIIEKHVIEWIMSTIKTLNIKCKIDLENKVVIINKDSNEQNDIIMNMLEGINKRMVEMKGKIKKKVIINTANI